MTIERAQIPKTASAVPPNGMLPDPPRSYDMRQRQQFYRIDSALKAYFSDRDDVLISGEGYLRHDPDNEDETFAPDLIVTFGVEDPDRIIARNGYVVSEVGKPPDFILEVASPSTGARDYTVKRDGYAPVQGGRVLAVRRIGRTLARRPARRRQARERAVRPVPHTQRTGRFGVGKQRNLGARPVLGQKNPALP